MREQLATLEAKLAAAKSEYAQLREKSSKTSHNSSTAPSHDPVSQPRHPGREGSGRSPGGQRGHHGAHRVLVDKPDRVQIVELRRCDRCGSRNVTRTKTAPHRHQVAEVPVAAGVVFEWQMCEGECRDCRHRAFAPLPEGVPTGWFGPRLQATISYLTGTLRVSRRMAAKAIEDLFGLSISLGSVSAAESVTAEALKAPVQEAQQAACRQRVADIDETGWRHHHGKAWLWVMSTTVATVFKVALDRGYGAFHSLTRGFRGILVSDRWVVYDEWDMAKRQLCWSHLVRAWTKFVERGGPSAEIGRALLVETRQMFHWWHKVRDGTMTRENFRRHMNPVITHVHGLLDRGMKLRSNHATRATCTRVRALAPALWTFIEVEGVEPTNNSAERRIRAAVQWRTVSLGTQSVAGWQFVERILTVTATVRQHGGNVFAYLVETMNNHLQGFPAPSLLRDQPPDSNRAA